MFRTTPASSPTLHVPRLLAAVAAVLALTAALVVGNWGAAAAPAAAHTDVKSVRPAKGSTVKTDITLVAVIFTGSVRTARAVVTGPGGKVVSKGTRRDPRNPKRFQTNLTGKPAVGGYKVALSWTASDGHKQSTSWSFKVAR